MRGNALLSPDTKNGYNSETANNYELGLKTTCSMTRYCST